jgi:hypothetical protein
MLPRVAVMPQRPRNPPGRMLSVPRLVPLAYAPLQHGHDLIGHASLDINAFGGSSHQQVLRLESETSPWRKSQCFWKPRGRRSNAGGGGRSRTTGEGGPPVCTRRSRGRWGGGRRRSLGLDLPNGGASPVWEINSARRRRPPEEGRPQLRINDCRQQTMQPLPSPAPQSSFTWGRLSTSLPRPAKREGQGLFLGARVADGVCYNHRLLRMGTTIGIENTSAPKRARAKSTVSKFMARRPFRKGE